ncbi:MAG: hypothetical protein U0270_12000 [Labilithrix sp.]
MRARLVATALVLSGCSAVLGADFDREGATPSSSGAPGGAVKTITPVDADGACPPARKRCGDACALKDDPTYGCGESRCTPCAVPRDGIAACNAQLACDFTCAAGFERVGDRCVGFRVERDDMPELLAVGGRNEHDVYVAGGTPYEPARLSRSTGGGDWTPIDVGAPNNRLVFGFGSSPDGGLFLATQCTSATGGPTDKQPFFRVDPSGVWGPVGIGLDDAAGTYARSVAGVTRDDLFVATGTKTVRHFHGGTWSTETTDLEDGQFVWVAQDGSHVLLIGGGGGVTLRSGDGKWYRMFTPPSALGIQAVWGPSLDDLYLVGANGLLMHTRNGRDFTTIPTNTTALLMGMWGFGQEHWLVGDGGAILHAGADDRYVPIPSGTDGMLRGIWGTSPTNIYIVGVVRELYRGFILRRS